MTVTINGTSTAVIPNAAGNLGLGTSTPSGKLHAYNASGATQVYAQSAGSSASDYANFIAAGGGYSILNQAYGSGPVYTIASATVYILGTSNSSPLTFVTNNTECARFDTSGSLLVGTTSNTGGYKVRITGNTGLLAETVNNTAITGSATGSGIGVLGQSSSNSGLYGSSTSGYGIQGSSGSSYAIYGQPQNSGFGGVIGYAQNGSNYGIVGYANAWVIYGAGSAYVSGTYQGSDERLKDNIVDLGNSLDKIAQLRAVSFDWKPNTDASINGVFSDVGLIAQEAINVLPDIVKEVQAPAPVEGKNVTLNQELGTFYTIDYGKLIPYMVDAIQELKQQNDALAARVAALEAK